MPLARLPWPWVCALTSPGISSRSPASMTAASSGAARPGGPIAAMVSPAISKSAGGAAWPAMSRRRPLRMMVWPGAAIALAHDLEMRLGRLQMQPVDRNDLQEPGAAVLHRHELGEVGAIERPGVDDLLAMRVDDPDDLPLGDEGRLALARRDGDMRHGSCSSFCRIKPIATLRLVPGGW